MASFVQVTNGSGPKVATGPTYTESANVVQDPKMIFGENYGASYVAISTLVSLGTANSHIFQLMAGASLKVRVRRIEVYQGAAVGTGVIADFNVLRLTSAGSGGSGITPTPLDPADSASGATSQSLPSSKGTEGVAIYAADTYLIQTVGASTQFTNPLWVVDYDRPRSKPLVIAAGTANGICIKNTAAYASATVRTICWFDETSF